MVYMYADDRTHSPQGVSGCGKSTVGSTLAKRLGVPFYDGDDLHPKSNVDKMSKGIPLTDEDRLPWLARIRASALTITRDASDDSANASDDDDEKERSPVVVIACSALKRRYRDILRGAEEHPNVQSAADSAEHEGLDHTEDKESKPLAPPAHLLKTFFVFVDGPKAVLMERMSARQGHFMKEKMLDSQLATLEPPYDEPDAVVVDLEAPVETQIDQAVTRLREHGFSMQ